MEVPFEMYQVTSRNNAATYVRSSVNLDSSWFDNVKAVYFEIVIDSGAAAFPVVVTLHNLTTGTTVATHNVPTGVLTPTRLRVAFNQPFTSGTYRVITTTATTYNVYSARIIIQQTCATKTAVMFPFANTSYSTAWSADLNGILTFTTSNAYSTNDGFSRWYYDSNNLKTISGFSFQAGLATGTGGVACYVSMYDETGLTQVAASELSTNVSGSVTFQTVSLPVSTTNLSSGKNYSVRIKNADNVSMCSIYSANLIVQLNPLTAAQSYYRISRLMSNISVATSNTQQRVLLDTSQFLNPTVFGYLSGYAGALGWGAAGSIYTAGVNTTGTGIASLLSSALYTNTSQQVENTGNISGTSGDDLYYNSSGDINGPTYTSAAFLVVRSSRGY